VKPAAKKGTPQPIPQGYEGATPYLCVKGAAAALDFYQKAFGATKTMPMAQPDGRIGHAEIPVGQALIKLADEFPEMNSRSPSSLGGSPVTLHLCVEDEDAFAKRATAAGMKVLRPVENQFYGAVGAVAEDLKIPLATCAGSPRIKKIFLRRKYGGAWLLFSPEA